VKVCKVVLQIYHVPHPQPLFMQQRHRARYYDGQIGRFLSEDPIEFESGDTNLYRYTWNSPTNFIDPSGKLVPAAAGAIGLVGTVIGILTAPVSVPVAVVGIIGGAAIGGAIGLYLNRPGEELQTLRNGLDFSNPLLEPQREPQRRNRRRPGTTTEPEPAPSVPVPNPNYCPPRRRTPCDGAIKGGSYLEVFAHNQGSGDVEIHHMPAENSIETSGIVLTQQPGWEGIAPALCITERHHVQTRSFGGGLHSYRSAYRVYQSHLIRTGRFNLAQNLDIADIRRIAPGEYETGIIQMVGYRTHLTSSGL
jgi:hypothetical protein